MVLCILLKKKGNSIEGGNKSFDINISTKVDIPLLLQVKRSPPGGMILIIAKFLYHGNLSR